MRVLYIITLFNVILFSCSKPSEVILPELSRAENLIFEYPDSALAILDSMETPSPSDKFQYATWCLLYTQAKDKNYMKHTSDTLINIAYSCFINSKDLKKKLTAIYIKGRVANDMHKIDDATIYYLQAKSLAKELKNYELAQVICANLGMIYAYRNLGDLAMVEIKDAYNYSVLANDSTNISYTLSYMGRVSAIFQKWDSCIYYYNQAMQIAKQSHNLKTLGMAFGEIAFAYERLHQYDSAIVYLKKAESIKIQNGHIGLHQTYLGLGRAYAEVQKYDSALYYLHEALQTDNIYTLSSIYSILYQINQEQKKFKEAIKFNELHKQYTDSINNISKTKKILELQASYKQEALIHKKNKLKLENYNLIKISLFIFSSMICIVYIIMFFYKRSITKRERYIQVVNNQIENHILQLNQNKEIIQRNNEVIQSMSEQLEKSQNLKEYINEQKKELNQIYEYNDYLQTQNTNLLNKINQSSLILRENEKNIHTYNEIQEQNIILKEKEKLLSEYMSEQLELFKQLKEVPKYIKDEQWPAIVRTVNILYRNFTVRLHKEFPALTDSDLQICCLIKLKFTTSVIASLTGVSPSSVTKRKQRIKERMSLQHPGLWDEKYSLEIHIQKY